MERGRVADQPQHANFLRVALTPTQRLVCDTRSDLVTIRGFWVPRCFSLPTLRLPCKSERVAEVYHHAYPEVRQISPAIGWPRLGSCQRWGADLLRARTPPGPAAVLDRASFASMR